MPEENNENIKVPDTHSFFINKIKSDVNFKSELKAQLQPKANDELKSEISSLRDDLNHKMTLPKVYISVKELSEKYSISESQQKGLRGRVNNPLPFYQDGQGGKIRYKVTEIEEWMSQQKVIRGI